MKVSLSNFLRWGGRKESQEDAEANGPFWGRKDRRRAARRVLAGTGWLCWVDESGDTRREVAAFSDVSEDGSGVGAILTHPVPTGPNCWAVGDDGVAYPLVVRRCDPCEEGYRLGARLDVEAKPGHGWGTAKLKWLDDDETLALSPASIRNADEGLVEVNAAQNPPEGRLLLLEGAEFACLCLLRKSTAYGDRRLLEVQPMFDAAPAARHKAVA